MRRLWGTQNALITPFSRMVKKTRNLDSAPDPFYPPHIELADLDVFVGQAALRSRLQTVLRGSLPLFFTSSTISRRKAR